MPDRTDELIRESLSSLPRPRPSSDLAAGVLARLAERPRRPQRAAWPAARVVLVLYWLAAAGASAWILSALPWPAWSAPSRWLPVSLVVAGGSALVLWVRPVTGIAVRCLRLLLADPRS